MREFCLQPGSDRNWTSMIPSVEEINTITELPLNDRRKIPQNEESNLGDKFPTCSPPQHNPDQ
ncbi:hypothetical protein ATANTOWER_012178, partial [Ataeniobius toweri]|nr:hypothetical protein [Ataeniobius toweri]